MLVAAMLARVVVRAEHVMVHHAAAPLPPEIIQADRQQDPARDPREQSAEFLIKLEAEPRDA
jgi:hypothetical protein